MQIFTVEAGKVSVKRLVKLREEIRDHEIHLAESNNHSFDFYRELGDLYLELSNLDSAIGCFKKAVEQMPEAGDTNLILARCYLDAERFEEAENTLTIVSHSVDETVSLEALYMLGQLRMHLRQMGKAELVFKEIPFRVSMASFRAVARGEIPRPVEDDPAVTRVVASLHRIQAWNKLVSSGTQQRDLKWLENKAQGRPIFITHICGSGWLFSHMISQIEMITRRLALEGVIEPFIIVINPNRFCNAALTKMYERSLWMVDDRYPRLRKRLIALRELLKSNGSQIAADIDPENHLTHVRNNMGAFKREFLDGKTVLEFTDEEEALGSDILSSFGVKNKQEFITFGVREPSYYRSAWVTAAGYQEYWEAAFWGQDKTVDGTDIEIHSKLLIENLNKVQTQIIDVLHTPIENYIPMLERMAKQGLTIFRMGTEVEQRLPENRNSKIVDYANVGRTEFADLYLFAKCKFLVTGGTGNVWLTLAFGKPVVSTDTYLLNCGSTGACTTMPNVIIPRMYWFKDEKRFLTLSEILECCRFYQWRDNCDIDGVEHVPNSAEDIYEAVDEMNKRLDGEWEDLPEDIDFRNKFYKLYRPYHEGYGLNTQLSSRFLRRNVNLIR